jgi:precorrin-6B methylase 2
LLPVGRLVINLVTLEHLALLQRLLPDARIVQVQINYGVPIQQMIRFEAKNPVFMATIKREHRETSDTTRQH